MGISSILRAQIVSDNDFVIAFSSIRFDSIRFNSIRFDSILSLCTGWAAGGAGGCISRELVSRFCHACPFLPALSLRATRVYHLLCCFCCSCSCVGVINHKTAIFANFVQFHHAFSTVGRQHIASLITGRRPADLQYILAAFFAVTSIKRF
jgi:hypothetical protein